MKSPSRGYCTTTRSKLASSLRTRRTIFEELATTSSSINSSRILRQRLKLRSRFKNSLTPMSLLRQEVVHLMANLKLFRKPFYGSTFALSLGSG